MKVYRGPSTKPFYDFTHEMVAVVTPDQLEKGLRDNALIRFNITKSPQDRQAVCTAQFEDADIVPMINGLLSRLGATQHALTQVKTVLRDQSLSEAEQVAALRDLLNL